VDDIVQGVIGALKYRRTPFEIFNLGESQTTTLSDLITAIENALGKKAVIEHLSEQQGDMPLTCANIDKARALLGYHPRVKISEGIPKFIDWYLKQQKR
jgi:UDP-glucuronate 4-epimerase